jgi:hypothetical protein
MPTGGGSWTLHYDWGLTGNFHIASVYFNFDGTFGYLAGGNNGTWLQVEGMIIWRFKILPLAKNNTIYTGNINGNLMSGIMFSSDGEKGRWYAIKKGSKVFALKEKKASPYFVEKESNPKLDANGQKTT